MALPTSNTTPIEDAYNQVVDLGGLIKGILVSHGELIAAGNDLSVATLVNFYGVLNNAECTGLVLQGTPGLADFAKTKQGPDYDIDTEFMAAVVACRAVTDGVLASMPSDGKGGFVGWQHGDDGKISVAMVPAAQLAGLANLITAAVATFAR